MSRGQIFSVDLLLALAIIVLAIGLVTNVWSQQLSQKSSSVEHAKMQQLAIDAAALKYYNNGYLELNESAAKLGYSIGDDKPDSTCIASTRGTHDNPVEVFVCRGE